MKHVATGLDRLREGYWHRLKGGRLGYLSNPASLDSRLTSGRRILQERLPGQLRVLLGPQHGVGAADQDNMIETDHAFDRELDIPVFSLYSETREPTRDMLDRIDVLIIDLQDVGTRVYTFASTMLNCLRGAARHKKKVLLLDRPNPIGGDTVEGPLLREEFTSFVGPFRLPMRHGLTLGEMALLFNDALRIGCDLEILPMAGWSRPMTWKDTGLHWVMPSPNMPLPETAQVYPGQVLWEGTNVSEGRGTCRPFEIFGAPFLDTGAILRDLDKRVLEGVYLQEMVFRPTFHKWQGDLCHGFMIHILDPRAYRPYLLTTALLLSVLTRHEERFHWRSPPYEYEYEKLPIDVIIGDASVRRDMEKGKDVYSIKQGWEEELAGYLEMRKPYLLYR